MAWSIFDTGQGGGTAAAVQWADTLVTAVGAPLTAGTEKFVYDWELSEGGGGKYNPLNQGPVPGRPELTTTGSQYGGGAADFASPAAGIQGAVAYLNMPAYAGVKAGLVANDPAAAEAALIASPWAASHYGGGSAFASQPVPAGASGVGGTGTLLDLHVPGTGINIPTSPGEAAKAAGNAIIKPFVDWVDSWAVRGFLIAAGAVAVLVGLDKLFGTEVGDVVEHPTHPLQDKERWEAQKAARKTAREGPGPAPSGAREHPYLGQAASSAAGSAAAAGTRRALASRQLRKQAAKQGGGAVKTAASDVAKTGEEAGEVVMA